MTSMLNGTMSAAKNLVDAARDGADHAFDSARQGAEHAFDSARQGTEHAATSTRSALLEVVHTLGGLLVTLRGLDRDDMLGWVGLERRRGALPSIAVFGAGMVVGAGIGMLFAPMSGAEMRSTILERLKGVKEDVKGSINEAASEVKQAEGKVEKKVEDIAGKAGDAVIAGAEAAKDAVVNKVDTATSAMKNAVDDLRSPKPQYAQGGASRHQS